MHDDLLVGVIVDTLKLIEGIACGAAGNGIRESRRSGRHDRVIAMVHTGPYNL